MRALLQDYVERHSHLTDAIIAWHASHTRSYQEEVKL